MPSGPPSARGGARGVASTAKCRGEREAGAPGRHHRAQLCRRAVRPSAPVLRSLGIERENFADSTGTLSGSIFSV